MGTFALLVLMSWSLGPVVRSSAIDSKLLSGGGYNDEGGPDSTAFTGTPSEESSEKTLLLTIGETQPAGVADSETPSTRADDAQQQLSPQVGEPLFIVQYPGDPRFFLATTATLFAGGQPLLQGIFDTSAATAQALAGGATTTAQQAFATGQNVAGGLTATSVAGLQGAIATSVAGLLGLTATNQALNQGVAATGQAVGQGLIGLTSASGQSILSSLGFRPQVAARLQGERALPLLPLPVPLPLPFPLPLPLPLNFPFWPFVNQPNQPQPPPFTFPFWPFVNLPNQPNLQVLPKPPLPGVVVGPVQPCPQVCTAGGVGTSTLDQMASACAASCRTAAFTAPIDQNRGSCLVACFKPTRESCITACGLLDPAANQALCATACAQLCPASVTPTPLLSNPLCCVQPPPICGAKGTFATQVLNCETNCANTFVGALAPDLPSCQQACSVFPSQACKATCNTRFDVNQVAQRTNCETACNRLCVLGTDTVTFTTGLHVSGRTYCRAVDLDTCGQATGSTALGLNLIVQKTNCETSCTNAAFAAPANRNICLRACTVQPQNNCVVACSAIPADDAADLAACNSACRNLCIV